MRHLGLLVALFLFACYALAILGGLHFLGIL